MECCDPAVVRFVNPGEFILSVEPHDFDHAQGGHRTPRRCRLVVFRFSCQRGGHAIIGVREQLQINIQGAFERPQGRRNVAGMLKDLPVHIYGLDAHRLPVGEVSRTCRWVVRHRCGVEDHEHALGRLDPHAHGRNVYRNRSGVRRGA